MSLQDLSYHSIDHQICCIFSLLTGRIQPLSSCQRFIVPKYWTEWITVLFLLLLSALTRPCTFSTSCFLPVSFLILKHLFYFYGSSSLMFLNSLTVYQLFFFVIGVIIVYSCTLSVLFCLSLRLFKAVWSTVWMPTLLLKYEYIHG